MIVAIYGRLEQVGADFAVVDVGGVSLRASIPSSTAMALPSMGEPVKLLTHLHLREDALALFGFATGDELRCFELLLTVRDVGPRLALAILSAAAPDALRTQIAAGDVAALTRIRGVGKRTAERLVLDLKEKVGPVTELALAGPGDGDLVAVLTNLGYPPAEAQAAARRAGSEPGLTLEERLRRALAELGRG